MERFDSKSTPWYIDAEKYTGAGTLRERLSFLIGYAVLAPSSHNTQPWLFRLGEDRIDLFCDESRWLRIADDDQRELFLSLGCALENLVIAAEHYGLGHEVSLLPDPTNQLHAAKVTFTERGSASSFRPSQLFDAITVRHTNHKTYEDRPISGEILDRLRSLCVEDDLDMY